jgi:hypothetical protein
MQRDCKDSDLYCTVHNKTSTNRDLIRHKADIG